MVTQKPISLKIDLDLLQELDEEVALGWRKRNSHINEAIRFYLELKDTQRLIKCRGSRREQQDIIEDFNKKWFPQAFAW